MDIVPEYKVDDFVERSVDFVTSGDSCVAKLGDNARPRIQRERKADRRRAERKQRPA